MAALPLIRISASPEALRNLKQSLSYDRAAIAVAMQGAVSDTVRTGEARIARHIGGAVNLRIGDIKKAIDSGKGSYRDPSGYISVANDKPVWLVQYMTAAQRRTRLRNIAGNLFAQVRPAGGLRIKVRKRPSGKYSTNERFPKAFLSVMPTSLHLGVFERVGVKRVMKAGAYKGRVREVIRRKRGPSPLAVFLNAVGEAGGAKIIDQTTEELTQVLHDNMDRKVAYILSGKGGRQIASARRALGEQ